MNTRSVGNSGEDAAADFLHQLGWTILERNVHLRFGEIDILADCDDAVVIVEVKAQKTAIAGTAVEMLTPAKQRTLRLLARFLQPRYNKPVRVDVIAIDNFGTPGQSLIHYPHAIEEI